MVPWEVGCDPRLKHVDVRIYFVLAACRRGSTVKIGTRLLGKYACTSQRRVLESIRRLKSSGYIEYERVKSGYRSEYKLTSLKFSVPSKSLITGEIKPVDAHKNLVCPKCTRPRPMLLNTGWCRSCNWDMKVRGIVQEEIGKTA
jgi:hypothetical protein